MEKKPWREALQLFLATLENTTRLREEKVEVEESLGRVTAQEVVAKMSSPHYDSAAMDGVAVKAATTVGASDSNPKRLLIGKDAELVDTGNPVPDGFDAVIMIEDVNPVEEQEVEIYSSVHPYKNVRRAGEDFRVGTPIVPGGHLIRSVDIGGMLSGGVTQIAVTRRPRVQVIPTGSELIEPGVEPKPGRIIEFNSRMICSMLSEWGAVPNRLDSVANDLTDMEAAIWTAIKENDIVVTIAGSSAGQRDLVPNVIEKLGEVLVHGVDLMPGKPVVLGMVEGRPAIGLPGYPVSAWVAADTFLKPLVYRMIDLEPRPRPKVKAALSEDIVSKLGMEELVRVTLKYVESGYRAVPLPRGAGLISSLIEADGIIRIPPDLEGLNEGSEVEVELLRSSTV